MLKKILIQLENLLAEAQSYINPEDESRSDYEYGLLDGRITAFEEAVGVVRKALDGAED